MSPHIFQISASSGGVPKLPVRAALVATTGLEGDRQNDTRHHGGPDRALLLFSLERIIALQEEGHPVFPGSIGENVTVAGLEWPDLREGVVVRLGPEVALEVTGFAAPCRKIRHSFREGNVARVHHDRYPGWSRVCTRVLQTGRISVGDTVSLTPAGPR